MLRCIESKDLDKPLDAGKAHNAKNFFSLTVRPEAGVTKMGG
jgi:hypothetical protein